MDPRSELPRPPFWLKTLDEVVIFWDQRVDTLGDKQYDPAAGVAYCICGLLMIAFLFGVATLPANDIFTVISLFIVVEGYTIVATLMLTMGLRRLLGPSSRFDQFLDRAWWRLLAWVVGSSLIVAGCWLIAAMSGRG